MAGDSRIERSVSVKNQRAPRSFGERAEEKVDLAQRMKAICRTALRWIIVWLPIVISLLVVMQSVRTYHYAVFEPAAGAILVLLLLPSVAILMFSRTKLQCRKRLRHILLACCILSVPLSFFMAHGVISRSETTDMRSYRDFDAECLVNRNNVFQALFPDWPHYFEEVRQADGSFETVYLDAEYYYCYKRVWDTTYDIYAQWPLNERDYEKEVARGSAVLRDAKEMYGGELTEMKKGSYQCLVWHSEGEEPFVPITGNYGYTMFAYDDQRRMVRYLCGSGMDDDIGLPYYMLLDW